MLVDPYMICLEFLPTQAAADLDLEVEQDSIDGRDFICTTVNYRHLSALSQRMYAAGWLLHEIEGNLAHVKVHKETGEKAPQDPMVMLVFARDADEGPHRIRPELN